MTEASVGAAAKRRIVLDDIVDAACALLTAYILTVAFTDAFNPVRIAAVLAFTVFVPGWAMVTNWPSMRAKSGIATSVVLSLSLLTIVSLVALWVQKWYPVRLLEGEGVVVELLLILSLVRRARAASRPIEEPRAE